MGKYAMKWRFRFNSKRSKTMMVGGNGGSGRLMRREWRLWKYSSVLIRRNVHLEKMREKAEKLEPRIGCMSRVNGEMEVDRGRLIWE